MARASRRLLKCRRGSKRRPHRKDSPGNGRSRRQACGNERPRPCAANSCRLERRSRQTTQQLGTRTRALSSAHPISGPELAHNSVMRSLSAGPRHMRRRGRCTVKPASTAQRTASRFPAGTSMNTCLPPHWRRASSSSSRPAVPLAMHGRICNPRAPGRALRKPPRRWLLSPCDPHPETRTRADAAISSSYCPRRGTILRLLFFL